MQDAHKIGSVATSDIGQNADAGEVVSVEHRQRFRPVDGSHGGVEDLGLLGSFAQVFEDRLTVDPIEGGLARTNALQQVTPGVIMLLAHHQGHCLLRALRVAAKGFGQRCEMELAVPVLGEDPDACQSPQ